MKLADKSDEEILQVATPIMDNLMQGSTEISHEKHTKGTSPPRMKGIVSKEYLEKVCNRFIKRSGVISQKESLLPYFGGLRRWP